MSSGQTFHHISSAVVAVKLDHVRDVIEAISAMEKTEVHGHQDGRIVVVLEGESTGELGDRLTAMAALDGVIAANMVFEHVEEVESV